MPVNGSTVTSSPARRTGDEKFDVIIVGGRCAGSPLASLLARAGVKVAVIEQATFPRETLSSHLMEADALQFLTRLGTLSAVQKTGVRFMKQTDVRLNDLRIAEPFPLRFDDVGGAVFLRRHLLDSILADDAVQAGADVRMGTKAVEVLWDSGRVSGVRVQHEGVETSLHAPLVVGADGRNSTVAYMCGSRKYNVNPNQRPYYFTFFEGADPAADDHFVFHRWGDRMVWAGPADSGLYLVGVSPEAHEREYFRRDTERGLLAQLRMCEPTATALADARIATKISGIVKFDGYFRQPCGPGWVLVGDSGHFKDPSAGRGIGDAFIQVETLVSAIIAGLGGSGPHLDEALRRWGEWRDRRFEGHYWLATILGGAGALPATVPEAVRGLQARGEIDRFLDLFSHRTKYYEVFPLRDMGAATRRLLVSGRHKRGPVLTETIKLLASEPRRRWINRHPALIHPDLTAAPPERPAGGEAVTAEPIPSSSPSLVADGSQ
jgi:flavin-dependent dehydrogenase